MPLFFVLCKLLMRRKDYFMRLSHYGKTVSDKDNIIANNLMLSDNFIKKQLQPLYAAQGYGFDTVGRNNPQFIRDF